MVVGRFSEELKSSVAPARLWKAAVLDSHSILPKIAPQFIASMEVVQGDGGVGTVKLLTFAAAVKELTSIKTRVDAIDGVSFYFKYSVIDGNKDKFESTWFEYKLEPLEDGGSLCKISGEYTTVGDYVPTEAEKKMNEEGALTMFKGIEAYLQANPEAYA